MELKVKKIQERTIRTKDITEETFYVMNLVHSTGMPKVTITQDEPFDGLNPEDVVTVDIKNPQTTLKKK